MAMIRQSWGYVFRCDHPDCATKLETHKKEWGGAVSFSRAAGWRAVQIKDVWHHFCGWIHFSSFLNASRTKLRNNMSGED